MKIPEAIPHLIESLESKDNELRINAANALGMIGRPEANKHLQRMLDDEEWIVRTSAQKALKQIAAAQDFGRRGH